jgi:hypothetical protein
MATPLWLSDNLCDEIGASPDVLLDTNDSTDDAPGHEVWRIADGLRDRTWWTPTTTNILRTIRVRSPIQRGVDTIVLDRGHNLGGKSISVRGFSSTGLLEDEYLSCTIPATVGGLPSDANGCLTPIVTGLAMGRSYRWPSHWTAPSAYDDRRRVSWVVNRESEAGVRVRRGRRVMRRVAMRTEVNAEDWTALLQAEFARVVDRGLPLWHCTDDGTTTGAGLLGLFQVAEDVDFDPVQAPIHRELSLDLDEVAPVRQR